MTDGTRGHKKHNMTKKEKQDLIMTLTREMQQASRALEFEHAAELRDMIFELEASMKEKGAKPKSSVSSTLSTKNKRIAKGKRNT